MDLNEMLHLLNRLAAQSRCEQLQQDPTARAKLLQQLAEEVEELKEYARKAATHPEEGCDILCDVEGARPYCAGEQASEWVLTLSPTYQVKIALFTLRQYGDLLIKQDAEAVLRGAEAAVSETTRE